MSWYQKLSNFLNTEPDQNKVREVKSEKYVNWPVIERGHKGMMWYGKDGNFELVLNLPSGPYSYSVFRSKNKEETAEKFSTLQEILPTLTGISSEVCNLNGVQRICDALAENPYWNLAHLAAYLELVDALGISPVTECINIEDPYSGLTPLLLAVKEPRINDKLNVIRALLAYGASFLHLDHNGDSVLHFAAETTKEVIKILANASTAHIDLKNKKGLTPLHIACESGKPECVKALCAAGANVNIESSNSSQPSSPPASSIGNFLDQQAKLSKEDVKTGGTPLHWCASREVIEVLVSMNCDINARNFNGAPPLHVMIIRNQFECVLALLALNADLELKDNNGQTALQLAIQQKSLPIVQALIVFYVNINYLNEKGQTARHMIAKECEKTEVSGDAASVSSKILYALHSVGAKRCSSRMPDCTVGCAPNHDFCGIPPAPPRTLPERNVQSLLEMLVENGDNKTKPNGHRILCLDGGGIRGLVLIGILLHLEIELGMSSVIKYFDWIAGTSTGGILALALAAGKSIRECLCLYLRMKDIAFGGTRPYDCTLLESLLIETFGETTVMADLQPFKVMVTGVIASEKPLDLHLFRSYTSPSDLISPPSPSSRRSPTMFKPPNEQLIWEAARSTGAAPSYFKQHCCFIDGGLISNNPTLDCLCEINEYNLAVQYVGRREEVLEPKVVVSVGTGRPPVTDLQPIELKKDLFKIDLASVMTAYRTVTTLNSLIDILTDQATQADGQVVDRARNWCAMLGVKYFRFNPQLSKDVALDEKNGEKLINMLWETRVYMTQKKENVYKLFNFLTSSERRQSL